MRQEMTKTHTIILMGILIGVLLITNSKGLPDGAIAQPAVFHDPSEIWPQGAGSGLDADTLDTLESSDFLLAAQTGGGISSGQVDTHVSGGNTITVKSTATTYMGDLGGRTGATQKCQAEFGEDYTFCNMNTLYMHQRQGGLVKWELSAESWIDGYDEANIGGYSISTGAVDNTNDNIDIGNIMRDFEENCNGWSNTAGSGNYIKGSGMWFEIDGCWASTPLAIACCTYSEPEKRRIEYYNEPGAAFIFYASSFVCADYGATSVTSFTMQDGTTRTACYLREGQSYTGMASDLAILIKENTDCMWPTSWIGNVTGTGYRLCRLNNIMYELPPNRIELFYGGFECPSGFTRLYAAGDPASPRSSLLWCEHNG